MRQAGIIAAAGLYALENNVGRLHKDHENALKVAKSRTKSANNAEHKSPLMIFFSAIKQFGQGVATIDESAVETNLVFARIDPKVTTAQLFVDRLEKVRFSFVFSNN